MSRTPVTPNSASPEDAPTGVVPDVYAGESLAVYIPYTNNHPEDVIQVYPEVVGEPVDGWTQGSGLSVQKPVAPGATERFPMKFSPPATAAPRVYSFLMRFMSGGRVLYERQRKIQVKAPRAGVNPQLAITNSASSPAPVAPTPAPPLNPANSGPAVGSALPGGSIVNDYLKEPAPSQGTPGNSPGSSAAPSFADMGLDPPSIHSVNNRPASPNTGSSLIWNTSPSPSGANTSGQQANTPPPPVNSLPPIETASSPQILASDYPSDPGSIYGRSGSSSQSSLGGQSGIGGSGSNRGNSGNSRGGGSGSGNGGGGSMEMQPLPDPAEPWQDDPLTNTTISLRPGQTKRIRFRFKNTGNTEVTYVMNIAAGSGVDGWIERITNQINISAGGEKALEFRLHPSQSAVTGNYPFQVEIGPLGGQLDPVALTLCVLPTPAVQLTAKQTAAKVGFFGVTADFLLEVQSAGNADTAFRIAVKSDPNSNSANSGPQDVYETTQWRYLFDKELETVKTPQRGQTQPPVQIRLSVLHKGRWWLGFQDEHAFRVEAVPVTEPSNCQIPGNSVNLKVFRDRRLHCLALLLMCFLLPISVLLASSPESMEVAGIEKAGYFNSDANTYWVTKPGGQKKEFALAWKAPWFAFLHVQETSPHTKTVSAFRLGGGQVTTLAEAGDQDRKLEYQYNVSRLIGGGDQNIKVNCIYTREDTPLEVRGDVTDQRVTPNGLEVTLRVPENGKAQLRLFNAATQYNRLNYWIAKPLSANSPFKARNVIPPGQLQQQQMSDPNDFEFRRNTSQGTTGDTDQIVVVTTDAKHSVLIVNLKTVKR